MLSSNLEFASQLIVWQQAHGRQDLPWQHDRSAYRVWLSEIMLQQTQVATVIPYFNRFVAEFNGVDSLARAPIDRVMQHWSGLGYYSRARNLHRCAEQVVSRFGGIFPDSIDLLESLPGIGPSTAAAIVALAFGKRAAILDGNVKRVLCRHFGVDGFPGDSKVARELWTLAQALAPERGIERYTQGLMDLGATLCTRSRPDCRRCPVVQTCVALRTDRIAQLPQRRPAKAIPDRYALLLVLRQDDQVLLLKRPPTGVWGGLWSLPQIEIDAAQYGGDTSASIDLIGPADHWLAQQQLRRTWLRQLPPIEHRFSHFRLLAVPLLIDVNVAVQPHRAGEQSAIWMPHSELAQAALPKPIKTLLTGAALSYHAIG